MVEVSDVVLAPIGSVRRTQVGREATEPMREDIRLLGTILGDTVREQTGGEVFDLVERAPVESFPVPRRRTGSDPQHRITELRRLRLHGHTQPEDGRGIERELRRHILTLWQTALIRLSRLKIQDEIETGLRYYPAAFFEVIPQVNAEVRTALQARWPDGQLLDEPILRPGSWIRGGP